MKPKPWTIAIDGPAGSGKSTLAKALARRLGYTYIDSGAMYRCVTLAAQRAGTNFQDPQALAALAKGIRIELKPAEERMRVLLNGEDVDDQIRTPEMSKLTSRYTANSPGVREALVARQREMGAEGGVVMEGRDIGSVVFPHADFKVYFDVSVGERAHRRIMEYQRRGIPFAAHEVEEDIALRDAEDRSRPIGPLVKAAGALEIHGDGKTVENTLQELLNYLPKELVPPLIPGTPEHL